MIIYLVGMGAYIEGVLPLFIKSGTILKVNTA